MKRKIKRVGNVKGLRDRLKGIAIFRITGPCHRTGEKVTVNFEGTRQEAEDLQLTKQVT